MASTTTVQLPLGPITAHKADGLVRAHGVPYGRAQRFRRAEPIADAWTEPISCLEKGVISPQAEFTLTNLLGNTFLEERVASEDCLSLSVVAPEAQPGATLPVVVWYHGGAYVNGTGDYAIFNTAPLARLGVVAVSVTYRLGILGYQPIKDLIPANLGLLDQILALKWVNKNIAAFGGDPKNVTIMGQSAGGDSVWSIGLAEGTDDLFHRSIIFSAPFSQRFERAAMEEAVEAMAAAKLTKDSYLSLPVDDIIQLQKGIRGYCQKFAQGGLCFAPRWGQYPLPAAAEVDKRFIDLTRRKPVIIAWTANESRPYVTRRPAINTVSKLPILGDMAVAYATRVSTERIWIQPAKKYQTAIDKAGGQCATLSFDWYPQSNPWKASHCMDMPFYLGTWDDWKDAPLVQGPDAQEVIERVGKEVKALFVSFAKGDVRPQGHYSVDSRFEAATVKQVPAQSKL